MEYSVFKTMFINEIVNYQKKNHGFPWFNYSNIIHAQQE